MSVVEDVRKVLQDTLAPDLKALTVRVEELERRMDLRFQGLERLMNGKFEAADKRADGIEQRFDDQRDYLEKRFDNVDKRFDGLERMLNQQQLINSLVERVRALESGVRATPVVHEESKMERAG